MPFKFNPFTGTLDEVSSGNGGGGDYLPLAGGTMDAGAEIVFASESLLRQSPSGRITLAVPFDDISTFDDDQYNVVQAGGTNGTVSITDGVITVSNPGSGYTDGIALIGEGGTRITISVIDGYGLDTVCAANYIHRWENGTLYITDPLPGQRIRVAQYKLTTPPDSSQDETLGYRVGSRYILDDGTTYICTNAAATDADWQLVPSGGSSATYIRTTLTSGGNTIASPGGTPANGDVRIYLLKQPASGVGTITFNAIFIFPDGYVPNVSTINNRTDLFEATYDSESAKWIATKFIGGLNL